MSPEAFFEWEEQQNVRHEYRDGRLIAMPGETRIHSRIATNLIVLLGEALRGTECQVHGPDMRVAVTPTRFFYPDLSAICRPEAFVDERQTTLANPTLVVEVLSKSTGVYDRGDKFEAYRGVASVQDVVFVETGRRAVEVYRRGAPWTLHEAENGVVALASVGVSVEVAAVYAGTGVGE